MFFNFENLISFFFKKRKQSGKIFIFGKKIKKKKILRIFIFGKRRITLGNFFFLIFPSLFFFFFLFFKKKQSQIQKRLKI